MSDTRFIIPGEQISRTPMLKLVRANKLAAEVYQDFVLWSNSGAPHTRAEFSDNRKCALLRAALPADPPIDDWALRYADSVHNFRSALDGLAWEVAHLDGARPSSNAARKLYFPMAKTKAHWETVARTSLCSVPGDVLARIRSVQPFMASDPRSFALPFLHEMDLHDKHRASLQVTLTARDRQTLMLKMSFPPGHHIESDPLANDGYEFLADGMELRNGMEIARLRAHTPFTDVSIQTLPLSLDTIVGGEQHQAFTLLRAIDRHVTGVFMIVLLGGLVPEWSDFVAFGAPRPTTAWI